MKRGSLFAAGAVALIGCAASPASDERAAQVASAIVGGEASDPSEDFVVFVVRTDETTGFCAGSLLAPNLVVTALHCVTETDAASFACDQNGNVVPGGGGYIKAVPDPAFIEVFAGVDALGRYARGEAPSAGVAQVIADGESALCSHDIAFLALDRPIKGMPLAALRLGERASAGKPITVSGWGEADDGRLHFQRRRRTGVPIVAVGPASATAETTLGATVPRTFLTGQGGCFGDSGAPAFVGNTVLGVMSRGIGFAVPPGGGSQCTADTANVGFTMIIDFGDLLHKAFAAANARPLAEGGMEVDWSPFGRSCTLDAECASNVCMRGAAGSTCNMDCGVAGAECPEGFRCEDTTRRCVAPTKESTSSDNGAADDPAGVDAHPESALTSSARSDCAAGGVRPTAPAPAAVLAVFGGALAAMAGRRRRRRLGAATTVLAVGFVLALTSACVEVDDVSDPGEGASLPPSNASVDRSEDASRERSDLEDPGEADDAGSGGATEDGGLADAADGGADSALADAADEGGDDAGPDTNEPPLPALCTTYPNSAISFNGPLFKRYFGIGLLTMQRAKADCRIGAHFASYGTTSPIQIACFVNELMAVAGCTDPNGNVLDYATSKDVNGVLCAPADATASSVRVGFHDPAERGIRNADLDRLLEIVEDVAANAAKMDPADAKRLRDALDARRSSAVSSTAAGYSAAAVGCDAGQ